MSRIHYFWVIGLLLPLSVQAQLDVKMFSCSFNYSLTTSCYEKNWLFADSKCGGGSVLQSTHLDIHWAKNLADANRTGCQLAHQYTRGINTYTYPKKCIRSQFLSGPKYYDGYCHKGIEYVPQNTRSHGCRCWEDKTTKTYIVKLRTASRERFLGVVNGGMGKVYANKIVSGFEDEFKIYDTNGGDLEDGDRIRIQSSMGTWVVNRGGILHANSGFTELSGIFDIYKKNRGTKVIQTGDEVEIKAYLNRPIKVFNGNASQVQVGERAHGDARFLIHILGKEQFGHPITTKIRVASSPNDEVGVFEDVDDSATIEVERGSRLDIQWEAQHATSCQFYPNVAMSPGHISSTRSQIHFTAMQDRYFLALICANPANHLIKRHRFEIKIVPRVAELSNGELKVFSQSLGMDSSPVQEGAVIEVPPLKQVKIEWETTEMDSCKIDLQSNQWNESKTELKGYFALYPEKGETIQISFQCSNKNVEKLLSFEVRAKEPQKAQQDVEDMQVIFISTHTETQTEIQTDIQTQMQIGQGY